MELLPFVTPLRNYPQNIANINEAIDKINNYYHTKGYILAGVNSVDDSDDGNLVFSITEGVIDKIFIEGNEKTKDYVITRNILTQPGTVYNKTTLKKIYQESIRPKYSKRLTVKYIRVRQQTENITLKSLLKRTALTVLRSEAVLITV